MKEKHILKILLLGSIFLTSIINGQILEPKCFKKELKEQKGILIDVRTPEEFNTERIEGARNINIASKNFLERLDSLDRSKAYFVYCGIGKRSSRAIIYMRELDFNRIYDLEGGLKAWKQAGLKTITN